MKNLFVIFFLLCPIIAKSQVWVSKGAVWHYEWSGIGSGGFQKIVYEKDTLIGGKLCNKLVPVSYPFAFNEKHEIVPLGKSSLKSQFTYVSGDTVFYLVNGKFHILYNFGAKPGDVWDLGVDTSMFKCSKSYVKVDSIGKITINSKTYRWISMSSLSNSSFGLNGKFVERFGAINSYLFPEMRTCTTNIAIDFYTYKFNCFEDNDFPLYNILNKDCEYLLKVGIPDVKRITEIYPIPTTGKIFLNGKEDVDVNVTVYTISGQAVLNKSKVSEIDLSNFEDGTYFIRVEDKYGNVTLRKIMKMR